MPILSVRENFVLRLRAKGKSWDEIAANLQTSLACAYVYGHRLRKKTGIPKTSPQACKEYLGSHQDVFTPGAIRTGSNGKDQFGNRFPTWAQHRAMHMYSLGLSYVRIAQKLGLSPGTIANQITTGCSRAGKIPRQSRIEDLQKYFASLSQNDFPRPSADPMEEPMFQ